MANNANDKSVIDRLLDIQERHLEALNKLNDSINAMSHRFELFEKDFESEAEAIKKNQEDHSNKLKSVEKTVEDTTKTIESRDEGLRKTVWIVTFVLSFIASIVGLLIAYFKTSGG